MAAENSTQPWRWLPANLPNMYVSAAGIARIDSISTKLVSGVGFSNGCAELALKKPPPLVPSSLMISCEATGPWPITWAAPSRVVTCVGASKFCTTPCETRTSAPTMQIGSRT